MDSNYNLSGLTNRIKMRLKDAQYSESDIAQFINDAYFEILGDTHYQFLEKIYRASAQDGGPFLLPPDFQSTAHFTAKLNKTIHPMRYIPASEFFDATRGASVKDFTYTIYGKELFYSLPNIEDRKDEYGDEMFYELTLYYLAKPKTLVNPTDMPVIPYEFGETIVLLALARAEQLRDNFDYAQIYENKADDLITSMKERYCPRQQEGANRAKLPVFLKTRY